MGEKSREGHARSCEFPGVARTLFVNCYLSFKTISVSSFCFVTSLSQRPRTPLASPANHARTSSNASEETSGDLSAARPCAIPAPTTAHHGPAPNGRGPGVHCVQAAQGACFSGTRQGRVAGGARGGSTRLRVLVPTPFPRARRHHPSSGQDVHSDTCTFVSTSYLQLSSLPLPFSVPRTRLSFRPLLT